MDGNTHADLAIIDALDPVNAIAIGRQAIAFAAGRAICAVAVGSR